MNRMWRRLGDRPKQLIAPCRRSASWSRSSAHTWRRAISLKAPGSNPSGAELREIARCEGQIRSRWSLLRASWSGQRTVEPRRLHAIALKLGSDRQNESRRPTQQPQLRGLLPVPQRHASVPRRNPEIHTLSNSSKLGPTPFSLREFATAPAVGSSAGRGRDRTCTRSQR